MFSQTLSNILRAVASSLETPVVLVLLLLMAAALVLLGSLIVECFTERRHLKVCLPELLDELRAASPEELPDCIEKSGLLRRQKRALLEVTRHPALTQDMREALAIRLLDEEKQRHAKIVRLSDLVAKLGPMFGLLGTLIPLGPGIIALGQGDTFTLSNSLLTAFDTTIAGLICAAFAVVISMIRKSWYANDMSLLETAMESVVEVSQHAETKAEA